jgi:hypothetical protein
MIDPQYAHVGPAASAALGNFTERVVVDAEKADGPSRAASGRLNQRSFGSKARETETVSATGLLDQSSVAKSLEYAGGFPTHIITDREYKAGSQLSKGRAGSGKCRRIGEETPTREKRIELTRARCDIAAPELLYFRDVKGDPPKHLIGCFRRLTVLPAAYVAPFQHLPRVVRKLHAGKVAWQGRGRQQSVSRFGVYLGTHMQLPGLRAGT